VSELSTRSPDEDRHRLPVRTLFAASIGNAVEWYDWTIYATFSIFFATQIFPSGNDALALLSTLATFAVAFFFRPLGGVVLGRFADLRGRRPAMVLTILLMAGGSVLIGVLPTYSAVGWLAPVLLLVARIAQGMSLGGEVSNAAAYLSEIAPPARRGRYSSFFFISTGTAVLIASVLAFVLSSALTREQLAAWGWRVPFLIGGVLGLVGLWMRRRMSETEQFEANKETAARIKNPLLLTLREHPRAVLQLVGLTLLNTLCYYTFFSALTPFATRSRGVDASDVFLALSIATVMFILLQYPMGALSDRYGRRPQLLVWASATGVVVVPLSFLVRPGFWNILVVFVVGLGLFTLWTAISPAMLGELFPTSVRALGIGAWYNLTTAVFGGTAPLVVQALQQADLAIVYFGYVAVSAVIAFCAILSLPETRGTVLR
jgi:MHS family alpha-ketoglutarate permease-like MFS transporter